MARSVSFDVLAVAEGVGFDELGAKISGIARDTQTHVSGLVAAAAAFGPALIPIGAAVTAVGAGLAGLGTVGILAFMGIRDEMQQGSILGRAYANALVPIENEFRALKYLAAVQMFTGINTAVQSSRRLFPFLAQDVSLLAGQLGQIVAHIAPGLVALFVRLNPLLVGVGGQLVKLSAGFERWATSGTGVTKFVAYAQANLPHVEKVLGQIAVAIGHLVQGLVPLGGVSFSTIGAFAKLVNAIPVPVLQHLAPLIAGIVVATKAWTVAMAALDVVLTANPIGVVVVGLAALGTAFVELMNHSRPFRTFMEHLFLDVASIAIHAMQSINHGFFSPFLTGLVDVFRALGYLPGQMGHNFRAAANAVAGFRDDVTRQLDAAQKKLSSLRANVDIANAKNNVAALRIAIGGLQNKTVTVTTYLDVVHRNFNIQMAAGGLYGEHGGPGTGPSYYQARASGGPVMAGQSYIVGESRPELFTPTQSGYITPYVPGGGGVTNVTINVLNGDPRATVRELEQWVGRGGKVHIGRGIAP